MFYSVGNTKTIFPDCRTLYKGKQSAPLEKGEVTTYSGGFYMLDVTFFERQIGKSPYLPLYNIPVKPRFSLNDETTLRIDYSEGERNRIVVFKGNPKYLSMMLEGKMKLTTLLRQEMIEFHGTLRQRLKWEAIFYLSSHWEQISAGVLIKSAKNI
jgi:hypothetical protein